jgi:hypothetical protein
MRALILFVCLTGFVAKDIARLGWEIWFKINQAEIIAEKCENKSKPMLHCNGKCYLSKQLAKLEQKEQNHNSKSNPFSDPLKLEFLPFNNQFIITYLPNTKTDIVVNFSENRLKSEYLSFTFHPPTC